MVGSATITADKTNFRSQFITHDFGAGTGTKTIPTAFRAKRLEVIGLDMQNDTSAYFCSGLAIEDNSGNITQRGCAIAQTRTRRSASAFLSIDNNSNAIIGSVTSFNEDSVTVNLSSNGNAALRSFHIVVYDY